MKVKTYNAEGKEAGTTELPERIFKVKLNPDLVHQVLLSQQANRRQVSAHAKTRGEVSGGGRKPWAQKHTGRARHGSTRSPIWVGGGVTHGPRSERVFTKKINKKMRRKALCMVLSEKVKNDLIVLVEDFRMAKGRTKEFESLMRELPCDKKNTLVALPTMRKEIIRAVRNLPYVKTMQARELNVLDVLHARYVLMVPDSLSVIEKTLV